LVDILIYINKIIPYTKKDIDQGYTPLEIYKLCSCIREMFCLSYAIRKENILWLYFQDQHIFIEFNGNKIRFLGSDERSQALLLKKALYTLDQKKTHNPNKWIKSTPGIFIRKFNDDESFISYLGSYNLRPIVIVANNKMYSKIDSQICFDILSKVKTFNYFENIEDYLYIIQLNCEDDDYLIDLLNIIKNNNPKMFERIKIMEFNKIKPSEDIILYLNYQIDKQLKK